MGLPQTESQCLCPLDQDSHPGKGPPAARFAPLLFSPNSLPASSSSFSSSSSSSSRITRHRRRLVHHSVLPTPPPPPPPPAIRRSPSFYDGSDAQKCIEACRRGFLSALPLTATPLPLPRPSSLSSSSGQAVTTDDGVSLPAACSALSGTSVQSEALWQLYWCDSAFCGVWIDANGGVGQDPNVDLFINECQNIGYSSIFDPGPPPATYSCSSLLTAGSSGGNPCRKLAAATVPPPAAPPLSSPNNLAATTTTQPTVSYTNQSGWPSDRSGAAVATAAAATATATTTMITRTSGTTSSGTPATAAAATTATATGVTGAKTSSSSSTAHASSPTAGAKTAIAVCSILAAALLAGLVYFVWKKRRSRSRSRSRLATQPYHHRGSGMSDGIGRDGIGRRGDGGGGSPSGTASLLKTRLRKSQMLFLPGHLRRGPGSRHPPGHAADDDGVPTPLISPVTSCNNSVRGVINANNGSPADAANAAGHLSSPPRLQAATSRSVRSLWPSSLLSSSVLFFSRRRGGRGGDDDRSISPPLTSLSPPPSPTGGGGGGGENHARGSGGNGSLGYYGYSGSPVPYHFPSSPICAPTTNKLEPRRERTPTIKSNNKSETSLAAAAAKQPQALGYYNFQIHRQPPVPPPPVPRPYSTAPDRHSAASSAGVASSSISARGLLRSSYGSYATTVTNASIPASASLLYGNALTTNTVEPMTTPVPGLSVAPSPFPLPTPPSPASPARPPRPHESPLEIPDLVMPDPPPLPPPPRGSAPPLSSSSSGTTAFREAGASRSFSMPASAFSFSSLAGRKRAPPPPPPTLLHPPAAADEVVYTNSLDSFSSHPAAIANAAVATKTRQARMNPKDPIRPVGPPPNRALPSPPPPPVPPMSHKRLSGAKAASASAPASAPTSSNAVVATSLSPLLPLPTVSDDAESLASFELQPSPLQRDGDDADDRGRSSCVQNESTKDGQNHKKKEDDTTSSKPVTSSFSSTMSAASMLSSSSTAETATTATTVTTRSLTAAVSAAAPLAASTTQSLNAESAALVAPFYSAASKTSSSLTIKHPDKTEDNSKDTSMISSASSP